MLKEKFEKKLNLLDEEIAYHTAMEKHHKKEKETLLKHRIEFLDKYLKENSNES